MTCTLCPLHEGATSNCIQGVGVTPSDVLFVGEAPGREDDTQGKPFTEEDGLLLRSMLRNVRYSYRLTNAVRCHPPGNKRPNAKEWKTCSKEHLEAEIERENPKLIVTLGDVAMRAVLGIGGPLKNGGQVFIREKDKRQVYPIAHPSYVLREPGYKLRWEQYLAVIPRLLVPEGKKIKQTYHLLTDKTEVKSTLDSIIETAPMCSFDYETTSLDPWKGKVISVAVCPVDGVAYCFDPNVNRRSWVKFLRSEVQKAVQAADFEMIWSLVHFGTLPKNIVWDTKLGAILEHEEKPNSLKHMALSETDMGDYSANMRGEGEVNFRSKFDGCSIEDLCDYNCGDADATTRITKVQTERVTLGLPEELRYDSRLWLMARSLEYVELLAKMRHRGVTIQAEKIPVLTEELCSRRDEIAEQMSRRHLTVRMLEEDKGGKINLASPADCRKLLFNLCGLTPLAKSEATGLPSASKEFLKRNVDHPVCRDILEWRTLDQIRKNFLETLGREHTDGVIHPQWKVGGARTFRLSCAHPNLQNIPHDERVRRLIVPRPGNVFIQADYSQIELRVMACLTGDESFLTAFAEGLDPHGQTASKVYGVRPSNVTKEMRNRAKNINFGVLYGITPDGMEAKFGVPKEEAAEMLEKFWETHPKISEWIQEQHKMAQEKGYVLSPFDRIRHLEGAQSSERGPKNRALRQAGNMPIQSAAAEITLLASLDIEKELPGLLFGQVHDSTLLETKRRYVRSHAHKVKEIMEAMSEKLDWITIPLHVDVETGKDWFEMEQLV